MKKQFFIAAIAIGILVQFGVLAWMLVNRELTLRHGDVCLLQTAPVDPADPFRGRYVALRYAGLNNVKVEGEQNTWARGKPVWITFKTDESSVGTIDEVLLNKPDNPLCMKAYIQYSWKDYAPADPPVTNEWGQVERGPTGKVKLTFNDLPIERFYLPEKLAPEAENAYRKAINSAFNKDNNEEKADKVFAKVRFRKGQAVIEDLLFDDVPLREYLCNAGKTKQ